MSGFNRKEALLSLGEVTGEVEVTRESKKGLAVSFASSMAGSGGGEKELSCTESSSEAPETDPLPSAAGPEVSETIEGRSFRFSLMPFWDESPRT